MRAARLLHTHIRVPNQGHLLRGQSSVERYDCLACHRIDGRGGTLRPGGEGGMEGPDLSRIGAAGLPPDWYPKHLALHEAAADGPWKTSFGSIDQPSREAIGEYLGSHIGTALVEAKSLFNSLGCRGCHRVGGVGGDDGPDLTLTGDRRIRAGSISPKFPATQRWPTGMRNICGIRPSLSPAHSCPSSV